MPRSTTMTGWWKDVLDRSGGKIQLLAKLIGISPRTLHRWQTEGIKVPDLERRNAIRRVAGKTLLSRNDCPKFLNIKKRVDANITTD